MSVTSQNAKAGELMNSALEAIGKQVTERSSGDKPITGEEAIQMIRTMTSGTSNGSGVPEFTVDAIGTVKRGRGRPKGSLNKPKVVEAQPVVAAAETTAPTPKARKARASKQATGVTEVVAESAPEQVKRGRGRPKGSLNKPKVIEAQAVAVPAQEQPKVRKARASKQTAEVTEAVAETAPGQVKRGRGRPKGSLNKPKAVEAQAVAVPAQEQPKVRKARASKQVVSEAVTEAVAETAPGQVKRSRGRPKGSLNKPKVVEAEAIADTAQPKARSLSGLRTKGLVFTAPTTEQAPAVAPNKSVFQDYIICLEDGKHYSMLKRPLRTHFSLTPEDYRAKWGLPENYPMTSPAHSERKKAEAAAVGLGHRTGEFLKAKRVRQEVAA